MGDSDMLKHLQMGMHYERAFLIQLLEAILKGSGYILILFLQVKVSIWLFKINEKQYPYLRMLENGILVLMFLCFSISFPILSGFEALRIEISFLLQIIVGIAPLVFLFSKTLYWNTKLGGSLILLIIFLQAFILYSLQDICICLFNKEFGISIFSKEYQMSTRLTRHIYLPAGKVCKDSQLCHIYTTLGENSSSEVYVQAQGGTNINQLVVLLCEIEDNKLGAECLPQTYKNVTISGSEVKGLETKGERKIFKQLITNLKQNTFYNMKFFEESGLLLGESNYKTLPDSQNNDSIVLAVGGDSGITDSAYQLVRQLQKVNPDVIYIGGDVSYDDGLRRCYYSWDTYLNMWEKDLFKPLNRSIPFVFALGNHDVGYNAMNNVSPSKELPLLLEYFTFSEKSTHHYHHVIGNTVFFSLDTGYYSSPSEQVPYIEEVSNFYKNYTKLAIYHVPIFPVCFDDSDVWGKDKFSMDAMEKAWVPIFEKHRFMGTFENHGHQFKRTFPLVQREIDYENGVVYFGDGSFGLEPPYLCPEEYHMNITQGIFQNLEHYNNSHIWIVKLQKSQVIFDAITPEGNFLEEGYIRNITSYQ